MSNSQDELDNHSNQMNPNNDAYWQSRGYDERPDDWDDDNSSNHHDDDDDDDDYYDLDENYYEPFGDSSDYEM